MNRKAIKAYNYYRRLESDTIHLYNFGDTHLVVLEEAKTVCRIVTSMSQYMDEEGVLRLPSVHLMDFMGQLGDKGVKVKTITYRNDEKQYDFPDVTRLKREKEWDM